MITRDPPPKAPATGDLSNAGNVGDDFDLTSFFPYLVRVYYRAVSEAVSSVYSSLYNLSVSEWRTMAVLGPNRALSASEIVERSSMDKVNVSRAIKGLRSAGFLKRDIDGDDRRRAVLRLTKDGINVFNALTPKVCEVEQKLLKGLSAKECETLVRLMAQVQGNARNFELK